MSILRRFSFVSLPLFTLLSLPLLGCNGNVSRRALPPEQAQELLLDRNWLDRLPETPRERIHVYRFVPKMGGGVYQDRTLYAGGFELFTFSADGQSILFRLHHTGEEVRVPFTIEKLSDEGKTPYDLHLHLEKSPRGPDDYYSVREPERASRKLDEKLRPLFLFDGR